MSFSAFPVPPQKTLFFVFFRRFQHSSAVSDVVGNSERFLRSSLVWFFTFFAACGSQSFSGSFTLVGFCSDVDLLFKSFPFNPFVPV